jgi:ApbE superfamily uncharacterized protein (UPF0280 family)
MNRRLRIAWLPDGKRLQLRDGPIDLIIQAFGRPGDIGRAYDAAIAQMRHLLETLQAEQADLNLPAPLSLQARAARRMNEAVLPFHHHPGMTPMAAFAGAVADDVLASMLEAAPLQRAFVHNTGEIALHLADGERFTGAQLNRPGRAVVPEKFVVEAASRTGGIAISGWSCRGHWLGIADAVTVAADNAATAEAAARLIASATDLPGHAAISRMPATALKIDAGLRDQHVTTAVGALTPAEKAQALAAGMAQARALTAGNLIRGAALYVQGEALALCEHPDNRALLLAHRTYTNGHKA